MHNKITVNDIPLGRHLKEEHERTKAAELKKVLAERPPIYRPIRERVSVAPPPISPIKVYSKAEVKMQDLQRKIQAEKSATRKILLVLFSGQPFTAKQIADLTGTKVHTVQGLISKIMNYDHLVSGLGHFGYTVDPSSRNERTYRWDGPAISIDVAHHKFLELIRASKQKVTDSPAPDLSQSPPDLSISPITPDSNFPGLDAFLAHCQVCKYKVTITIEV